MGRGSVVGVDERVQVWIGEGVDERVQVWIGEGMEGVDERVQVGGCG